MPYRILEQSPRIAPSGMPVKMKAKNFKKSGPGMPQAQVVTN